MIEIKFDPSTLSKSQREDLASFILGWDAQPVMTVTPVTSGKLEPGMDIHYGGKVIDTVSDAPGVIKSPNVALSSADADPSRTAPVDTQAHTLAGSAPLPPVPQPGTPVNTAAPQSPNHAEVDSKGMPWDERIHSSSRAKVAGGTWKYKRGVSEEEVKRVENELHNPSLEELFTAPVPGSGIVPPPPVGGIAALSGATGPVTNVGMATSEPDLRKEFAQLMIRVAQAKHDGKITAEEVTAALAAHAVPSLPMLSTKLDLVPSVAAAIDEIIASRG